VPAGRSADETRRAIAALQRLADRLVARRAQLAAEAGLTESQWRVLEEIAAPGFLPSLFARRSETSPAAVSKILRQLQDLDLVTASIAERDARQRRYVLSPRGRKTLAQIEAAREDAVREVWTRLDPGDLRRFSEVAEEVSTRLEHYAASRRRGKR
jgi:DNA-binding MarR family transcriptional regulator